MSTPRVNVRRAVVDYPAPTPLPTPCRIWQGAIGSHGYGVRTIEARTVLAHRWVMEQALGRRLETSEVVMHLCDNRPCFRFDHLRLGTIADNNADMYAKGRGRHTGPRGERARSAILTETDVIEIRGRYVKGRITHACLAAEYGVEITTIGAVLRRATWKHVS